MTTHSHLSAEEFKQYVHGKDGACYTGEATQRFPLLNRLEKSIGDELEVNAPASVDWEAQGKVTPVKNQGNVQPHPSHSPYIILNIPLV